MRPVGSLPVSWESAAFSWESAAFSETRMRPYGSHGSLGVFSAFGGKNSPGFSLGSVPLASPWGLSPWLLLGVCPPGFSLGSVPLASP
ncbi:MAG: hypothetical protein LBU18_03780, partial [Treponema sp.]|nr:hypothetical protein [Treponema sp.]